jgi:hypothetical protein
MPLSDSMAAFGTFRRGRDRPIGAIRASRSIRSIAAVRGPLDTIVVSVRQDRKTAPERGRKVSVSSHRRCPMRKLCVG